MAEPGTIAFATEGGGAVLTELAGAPRNIGLLVAPEARGVGIGTELGRAAASFAVRRHGYARWRCRDTNVPSARAADGLGFEPYATQPRSGVDRLRLQRRPRRFERLDGGLVAAA